ncbi:cordon-bleu protein-like 1 [Tachysurus vachellii]|uniref:cordon-bleu protein-like 1 n=1 Tax=Tachysurus vachellii TaxID=175792 RepID=UPI00296ABBF8|nr:cordon-bleu protein-like 1 [Tachysurus vachellii]XP_060724861.1 cordon-bleu protein-like 1 [Tachysurus vachellii]
MEQENLIEKDLALSVLLPEGHEKTVTVHGSKPVMDVLVILCAQYHLNPSDHVIEIFSTNHNKLKFQPSSLIGSLEAELVMLKPKRSDVRKAPNMPVATVRLLINYRRSHKAVVRVSPRVPLSELMPAVCEKCEMDPKSTVLLRDSQSNEPLDLTKTLDDYGIRVLYAKAVSGSPNDPAPVTQKDCKKVLGGKENTRLLGLFKRSKKSAEETRTNADAIAIGTAASLVLKDQHAIKTCCYEANSTSEMPKKRRAPQPPSMLSSQSASAEPNSSRQAAPPSGDNEKQGVLGRISSVKHNKRRAPLPPCTSLSLPDTSDKERSYFQADTKEDDPDGASFIQSRDFKPTRSSVPRYPLMTEVVSELTNRIKSMEQKDASFHWSVKHSPPASNLPPESGSVVDGDPVVSPGCEVLRHGSHRDGINTFTVVPQRRTQSTRRYEFLLTMENLETINGDTGGRMEDRISESRDTEEIEMSRKEMVILEKTDDEFENVVETNKQLGIKEAFGKLHLNIDAEEDPPEEDPPEEDPPEEDPPEEDPPEEHLAEKYLPEDRSEMEDNRDWIEEYRKRKMGFLSEDDRKEAKLKMFRKPFLHQMPDDVAPQPSKLSVCWEEEESETQVLEDTERFGKDEDDEDTLQNPNPSRYEPQHDPTSEEPYWDVNLSSNLQSSDTPFTSSSQSSPQNLQPNLLQSALPCDSNSTLEQNFELSSPNSQSLFAITVARRAQSLGNVVSPLIPSTRTISSPTPHPQRVGSQHTSSQKLYFQNLISQEFISKIPASLGPCTEAPPTSKAPPPEVMTTQARRQAWSSFSHTQMKNLKQV